MNTNQLNKVMRSDDFTSKYFLGTFSRDRLPQIKDFPSCLILNNKPSNHGGEHWIAIYFHKNKTAEFFDSFGNHPAFYNLIKYLKNNSKQFSYNKQRLQSFTSFYCGLYCCFYLMMKSRKRALKYILKQFSKSAIKNDNMFSKMIKKYF